MDEIQDLEFRMRLERSANVAPRFIIHRGVMKAQFQFNETFVFSEGARDCNDFSVTNRAVVEKVFEVFQTTVSAQPIRENGIVNVTIIKLTRALIASNDLCRSNYSSTRKVTAAQFDLEVGLGLQY
jgi:hypothetical protein